MQITGIVEPQHNEGPRDWLHFLKVLANNSSLACLVLVLERTFPTCSASNLPVDVSTGDVIHINQ